jgi:hypothetical protein
MEADTGVMMEQIDFENLLLKWQCGEIPTVAFYNKLQSENAKLKAQFNKIKIETENRNDGVSRACYHIATEALKDKDCKHEPVMQIDGSMKCSKCGTVIDHVRTEEE